MDNPFTLNFGVLPQKHISRTLIKNRIEDTFSADVPSTNTFMITGVRGSGKTVLLTDVGKELSERNDWIVVEVNPETDIMEDLTSKLYNIERIKPIFTRYKLDIGFSGSGVSFEKAEVAPSFDVIFEKMLGILAKENKRLLVSLDEAHNNTYIRKFVHSYQILLRKGYRIFLLMTGLHQNIHNLQNDKSLTFLYRASKIELPLLDTKAVADIYRSVFALTLPEAKHMADLTNGYPFAFQVLGYLKWENKDSTPEALIPEYDYYLAEYTYRKVWSELSATDQKVMYGLAQFENYAKIEDVRNAVGMTPSQFSTYRERLSTKGLVDISRYGHIRMILPRFSEYVKERVYYDSL